jgi:hypothetical protein
MSNKSLHPDADYIIHGAVGDVIAKGLSVLYKKKPSNPVDFFAKWLLNEAQLRKDMKAE